MYRRLSPKALLTSALLLSLAQLPSGCAKGINGPKTVPTADFSATPRSGPEPLAFTFTDRSSPGSSAITSVLWNFGDNQSSTVRNPQHTYAAPGNYTISLKVTNSDGSDIDTKADYITVANGTLPTAAFTATPTSGPPGMTVQFTDQSTPGSSPITSWSWTFGDGGTSTSQSPSHTYAAIGTYTVSLTVTTAVGPDAETKTGYIKVASGSPIADFSANPTSGTTPLTVTFTDRSVSGGTPITSWAWDFGDGGVSTSQNPNHIYLVGGTYTMSLTATNSRGSDTATKTNLIVATQSPVPPTAQFSGTPRSGNAPLTVQFTDQSTPGTSPITNRQWVFGDSATRSAQNPSHTYTNPGLYTVILSVASAVGDGREEKASYIQALVAPAAPTADFSGSPTSGTVPLQVQFTDLSLTGGTPITSWSWNFGDGGTSTTQNPSHTYLVPGTYNVSLTATNSVGPGSITKNGYINAQIVPVGPTAQFSGTPRSGNTPLAVQFTDQSTPGTSPITSWSWAFGDGGTSTSQSPSHVYAAIDTYTVSLTVTTAVGPDAETKAGYIKVASGSPIANFSANPTSGTPPLTVTFTDRSVSGGTPITSWAWAFGDGGVSTSQNPNHIYLVGGTYTVSLTATNSRGSDTATKTNLIVATQSPVPPTAQFSGTPRSGNAPLTVQFTDQSTPGTSPITNRQWVFGDSATRSAQNPSHTYT